MKGICFIEPLFHAVVNGSKTQTRRTFKEQQQGCFVPTDDGYSDGHYTLHKPRYKVGEVLYLKEPYYLANYQGGLMGLELKKAVKYKYGTMNENFEWQWKNKLFMPEKYARYFIKITAVRCEPLQDISDRDCFDEGIKQTEFRYEFGDVLQLYSVGNIVSETSVRDAFAELIDKISGRGTWQSNPYVWVYDFELIKK